MNNSRTMMQAAGICCALFLTAACQANGGEKSSNTSASQPEYSEAGLQLAPLTIQSGETTHQFTVEVALTGEQQAKGMMFRTSLAPDRGMLFPFPAERIASFWMKNTVIPLDIIFIRSDGTIESIAANAVPYSLDSVQSNEPVAAVLELAGGRASELGLEPGNVVRWQL